MAVTLRLSMTEETHQHLTIYAAGAGVRPEDAAPDLIERMLTLLMTNPGATPKRRTKKETRSALPIDVLTKTKPMPGLPEQVKQTEPYTPSTAAEPQTPDPVSQPAPGEPRTRATKVEIAFTQDSIIKILGESAPESGLALGTIQAMCPEVKSSTVRTALNRLVKQGTVEAVGKGRATRYRLMHQVADDD